MTLLLNQFSTFFLNQTKHSVYLFSLVKLNGLKKKSFLIIFIEKEHRKRRHTEYVASSVWPNATSEICLYNDKGQKKSAFRIVACGIDRSSWVELTAALPHSPRSRPSRSEHSRA